MNAKALNFQINQPELEKHQRDHSIFCGRPTAVLYPQTIFEIGEAIRFANEEKKNGTPISLTAWNGGTCMSGGPITESICVDLSKHLNKCIKFDAHHKLISVEAGIIYNDLENYLKKEGSSLFFAPYPSSKNIAGVGGMIGNNASGEQSHVYGATRENIHALMIFLADGSAIKTEEIDENGWMNRTKLNSLEGKLYSFCNDLLKNRQELIKSIRPETKKSALGYPFWSIFNQATQTYNLSRLFVGSQGTLGIVAEATLKLVEPKPFVANFVLSLKSLVGLGKLMVSLEHRGVTNVEIFDQMTYELGKKTIPEICRNCQFCENGFATLLISFESDQENDFSKGKERLIQEVNHLIEIKDKCEWESYLTLRRSSFKLFKEYTSKEFAIIPCIEDASVPLEQLQTFIEGVSTILNRYNFPFVFHGHILDGSIRFFPQVPKTISYEKIEEITLAVSQLALSLQGTMTTDHNDGLIKTCIFENLSDSEYVTLCRNLKDLVDPLHIFNPNKKVYGDEKLSKRLFSL